jgi:prepilin-type N-terminal cleavage/methylation domain-containing protein
MVFFTQKGFTLVEIMIVIAIIGVLAAALFPSLTSYISRAQDTRIRVKMLRIATAFDTYTNTHDTWVIAGAYG